MNYKKTKLKNGLTIITSPMKDSPSVTVLVMVKTGSKYETKDINGLSHFLEHMCFKGTVRRPTAKDIAIELDGLGAQHNAFTGEEYTGYYAKAHPKHFGKILDVVSDMYLNPTFNEKEIEKEKGVIIEEINMYEDLPQRKVHEVFSELMYGDQPAGWGIAGKKEIIKTIGRNHFINYRKKHYVASATTILVAGDINEKKAIEEIKKQFADISTDKKFGKKKVIEKQSKPQIKIKHKETDQTHLVLGVRTFDVKSEKNYPLSILVTVLGQGMSSRLFEKLRNEMGVCYYVRAGSNEFTDHGFLSVSAGVDVKRVDEVVKTVLSEMKKLAEEPIPESEIAKAKEFMLGNMYMGLEPSDSVAFYYAIQDAIDNQILTPAQYAKKIQAVTVKDIQKVAREIMQNKKLNLAIVGNVKNKESLSKIFHF